MKKSIFLTLSAMFFAACGGAADQTTVNINAPASSAPDSVIVSSHSSNQNSAVPNATIVPRSETKTKWTQSGNPIETAEFDAEIAAAEKNFKAKPKDEAAKKALAIAYVNRGLALTDARQYASALGDYRKAQKLDPANEDAKKWIDQIISIYDSINKEYPKEGEEPPPLPFKKDASDANKKASQ